MQVMIKDDLITKNGILLTDEEKAVVRLEYKDVIPTWDYETFKEYQDWTNVQEEYHELFKTSFNLGALLVDVEHGLFTANGSMCMRRPSKTCLIYKLSDIKEYHFEFVAPEDQLDRETAFGRVWFHVTLKEPNATLAFMVGSDLSNRIEEDGKIRFDLPEATVAFDEKFKDAINQ